MSSREIRASDSCVFSSSRLRLLISSAQRSVQRRRIGRGRVTTSINGFEAKATRSKRQVIAQSLSKRPARASLLPACCCVSLSACVRVRYFSFICTLLYIQPAVSNGQPVNPSLAVTTTTYKHHRGQQAGLKRTGGCYWRWFMTMESWRLRDSSFVSDRCSTFTYSFQSVASEGIF